MDTSRFPTGRTGFESFVRQAGPGLLRFGHVLTADRSAAEDLAQETLIPVSVLPETRQDDRALAGVESTAAVRDLLARLPRKQRAAIALRYVADMPVEEIGRLLDCSPQTVRSQMSRGLATLRQHLSTGR